MRPVRPARRPLPPARPRHPHHARSRPHRNCCLGTASSPSIGANRAACSPAIAARPASYTTRCSPRCPPPTVSGSASSASRRHPRATHRCVPPPAPSPARWGHTYPRPGEVFLIEPGYDRRTQTLALTAEIDPPLPEVTWRVHGRPLPLGRLALAYDTTWQLSPGQHTLDITAAGRHSEPIAFEVR